MQFDVLGPLRVTDVAGVDVTPRGEQQRKVLAMLVSAAPSPVSVDVLEELLWGGPAPSANAVQALISKLRKVIEPARIERDPRGYALAGEFTTDVAEFERLVAGGDHAAAERLVRGEPLADLADVAAVAAERARLGERSVPRGASGSRRWSKGRTRAMCRWSSRRWSRPSRSRRVGGRC